MKLLLGMLIFSSVAYAMQNPQNMSGELLECEFKKQQVTIAQQNKIIAEKNATLRLLHDLHYGTLLERASAKADLNRLKQMHYLNRYAIGK